MTDRNSDIIYSLADIERYLNGGMTAKEMHDMERAALQDPFLADAIDGYRNADAVVTNQHLNEIAASLQREESATVIPMSKKRSYGWLIAVSVLAVVATSIFLFSKQDEKQGTPLADNRIKTNRQADSVTGEPETSSQQADSQPVAPAELALPKPREKETDKSALAQKKKSSQDKEKLSHSAPRSEESAKEAMAYSAPSKSGKVVAETQSASPVLPDSTTAGLSASSKADVYARRQTKSANVWTNDKGKPFLLSDVQVISLGKKVQKSADTTSVKPDGGWQLFQDYLFSRLSRKDSLSFVNNSLSSGDLELEFSIDESGSPYNITVLHAQDSTVTNKIISAVQNGPKWTTRNKKEKRLRLRY